MLIQKTRAPLPPPLTVGNTSPAAINPSIPAAFSDFPLPDIQTCPPAPDPYNDAGIPGSIFFTYVTLYVSSSPSHKCAVANVHLSLIKGVDAVIASQMGTVDGDGLECRVEND
jgi:hypothetical protein